MSSCSPPTPELFYDQDGNPIDLRTFAELAESHQRVVAYSLVGDVEVLTVWLGVNHNFIGIGPPIIFETKIFGGEHHLRMARYATKEGARAGHDLVVKALRDGAELP